MADNKSTLESSVESFVNDEVLRRGGFTVKLNPKGYKGIPDRLAILNNRVIFIELKRPRGGVTAQLQTWWQERLRGLGAEAYVCKNRRQVLDVLDNRG